MLGVANYFLICFLRNMRGRVIMIPNEYCLVFQYMVYNHGKDREVWKKGVTQFFGGDILQEGRFSKFWAWSPIKVLPSEEWIFQHKLLVFVYETWEIKGTKGKFALKRKIWKLNKGNVKSDFRSYINSKKKLWSVVEMWETLKYEVFFLCCLQKGCR